MKMHVREDIRVDEVREDTTIGRTGEIDTREHAVPVKPMERSVRLGCKLHRVSAVPNILSTDEFAREAAQDGARSERQLGMDGRKVPGQIRVSLFDGNQSLGFGPSGRPPGGDPGG
jgi:hypothetical protein